MGTRNGAESVKLSKMKVKMNKPSSLDGVSAHWWTFNLIDLQPVSHALIQF
jgi:hypothetical protein